MVVLKDVTRPEVEALLTYMYIGEVNVLQENLPGLLKAAECLQIKGLAVPDDVTSASSGRATTDRTTTNTGKNITSGGTSQTRATATSSSKRSLTTVDIVADETGPVSKRCKRSDLTSATRPNANIANSKRQSQQSQNLSTTKDNSVSEFFIFISVYSVVQLSKPINLLC